MECDICGQDVENSEELLSHMERAHPAGQGDLEMPDHLGETPGESAEREVPKPTHWRRYLRYPLHQIVDAHTYLDKGHKKEMW